MSQPSLGVATGGIMLLGNLVSRHGYCVTIGLATLRE